MQHKVTWGVMGIALLTAFVVGIAFTSSQVFAQTATSPNYQMTESEFGATSSDESCSGSYCSKVTMGTLGNTSGETTPAFEPVEYSEPMLEMIVTPGASTMGDLSTEVTGTQLMYVKIRNYLTEGYILQIIGDAPHSDSHTISTVSTVEDSQPGRERFGINVVANTTPAVGANPAFEPGDQGAFGQAEPGYNTTDMFKYTSGDVVARSLQDTGATTYTITMIMNIASSTPAGKYGGDFAAVLIPSY